MYDMIQVAMAPTQPQSFIDELTGYWRDKAESAVPEFTSTETRKPQGGKPLPWDYAGNLLLRQFAVMKKVNGVGR